MEIDPPSPHEEDPPINPRDRLLERLMAHGVPEENLHELQSGLVGYVKNNGAVIPELVPVILPSDEDVKKVAKEGRPGAKKRVSSLAARNLFRESIVWLKWLMFEGEPSTALENLAGQRGVCGAVWGKDDIAFQCRTCEHDPTCAICVLCFQNGNHENHDYSIIYTGGGCCDCGDETAWKREGFCSKHQGVGMIQPLPDHIVSSVGPVLDALFVYWKSKLILTENMSRGNTRPGNYADIKIVANELTYSIVETLLDFCNHSESLLSFVSKRVSSLVGFLDILIKSEKFLIDIATKRLYELLLKLLGDPVFKYDFAKAFVNYYPIKVDETVKNSSDQATKKYQLHSTFSVQIFTVPTLTPRLVKEVNLLSVLLDCLGEVLLSCAGEDGRLQIDKWANLFDTSYRILEDIKFVLGHAEVVKHLMQDQQVIGRAWLRILSYVQGVSSLKRETNVHVEEEYDNIYLPFAFCHSIAHINSLLISGAFSISHANDTCEQTPINTVEVDADHGFARHTKVGRLSQESSASTSIGQSSGSDSVSLDSDMKIDGDHLVSVPSSVSWLALECLRTLDCWLDSVTCDVSDDAATENTGFRMKKISAFKKALSKVREGKYMLSDRVLVTDEAADKYTTVASEVSEVRQILCPLDSAVMNVDDPHHLAENNDKDTIMEPGYETETFWVLKSPDWPTIDYDVSCQEISVHIPLHEFLAVILRQALGKCFRTCLSANMISCSYSNLFPPSCSDFFEQVLRGCHPCGFSSFVMEHPLRNRVFCAQVHAGMWRNGDAAVLSCDWHRSVQLSSHRLELELFLLQFCAALSPDDLFVRRILERFGLLDYLSLNPDLYNETEPAMVQEMLTLIIQIVKERRFCGFTASESLQRELVCKLASGDATHSQLVKSLPRDLAKADQLQNVLDGISQYSNPSGMNQGKYALRPQYWKELDLYHLRWNPRDLQVAEDRYLQFCGVSAFSKQLPKWTKIYQPLSAIARIATCRMVVQIIQTVLFYSVFTDEAIQSRAPDAVLVTALHLLSLGLDICSVQKESGHQFLGDGNKIPLLALAGEDIHCGGSQQSLLSLLVLVMRIHKKHGQGYGESSNINLSSLVEGLLKQFAKLDAGCMNKLQQFASEVVDHLFGISEKKYADYSLDSDVDKRKAKAQERQAAIMAKMKAQQSKFSATIEDTVGCDSVRLGEQKLASCVSQDLENCVQETCSLCHDANSKDPVSFLIFLQKSRLVSFVDRGPLSWDQDVQKDSGSFSPKDGRWPDPSGSDEHTEIPATSSDMSEEHSEIPLTPGSDVSEEHSEISVTSHIGELLHAAVHDFAHHACPDEISAFIDYFKLRIPGLKLTNLPRETDMGREKAVCSIESVEEDIFLSIQKDINNPVSEFDIREADKKHPGEVSRESSDMDSVLHGKYIANLTREEGDICASLQIGGSYTSDLPSDGFGPSGCDGIHVSSCGHAVHQECLDRYLSSLKERFTRRIVFEGAPIIDPDLGEFLCPVCRRLSNSILPVVPGDSQKLWNLPMVSIGDGPDSPCSLNPAVTFSLRLRHAVYLLGSTASIVAKGDILKALPLQQDRRARKDLEPIFRVLCGMYFFGKQDIFSKSRRVSPSLLMWDTVKYTIVSTEIAARCGKGNTVSGTSDSSLYNELKSSGGLTLPLLLQVVQSTRSKNLLDMLLRLKGIQFYADSICSGGRSKESSDGTTGGGNVLNILKHVDGDVTFPDIHFWDKAGDPVLVQDPFSTLMWILFCLPYPILSCRRSLFSLVHMLYAVSVVQAITMNFGRSQSVVEELGSPDSLLIDLFKLVRESGIGQQYFVSNYPDSSGNLKDSIRSLCSPFLRKCALLWGLLSSASSALFPSGGQTFGGTSDAASKMEICSSVIQSDEFSDLENMFELPPLDAVLSDTLLRALAFKWFNHFQEKFVHRRVHRVRHLNPLVPFQLMQLPLLYQDLVQRYIKTRCPECKKVLDEPTLCLLCGRICAPTLKSCCGRSGCLSHATVCGAGTGVFLLIRRTKILLQRNSRQATWPSPYLDAFGEEDVLMQRGKPLYLNEERYAALNYMVASHGLSKVLRQTTVGTLFLL